MEHVRVLVAPLNWGLGHATRCVPIVERLLAEGNDVVLAGNGDSLAVLRQKFPKLNLLRLPDFEMTYSKGKSQVPGFSNDSCVAVCYLQFLCRP